MEGESEDAVGGGEDVEQRLVVWSLRLDEIEQTTSDLRESVSRFRECPVLIDGVDGGAIPERRGRGGGRRMCGSRRGRAASWTDVRRRSEEGDPPAHGRPSPLTTAHISPIRDACGSTAS
jgi:hypothetical protein